jgi:hypothetical protein
MTRQSCRHTGRIVDQLMSGEGLQPAQVAHAGSCRGCSSAVEQATWLAGSLPRLLPALVSEPLPAAVLALPTTLPLNSGRRGLRPLMATAAVAVAVVAAVVVGSQLAVLIDPARTGNVPGASDRGAPAETADGLDAPIPEDRIPSCGYPSGIHPPRDPVAVLESLETLGDVPRVAMERHGTTVVSLFARLQGDAQASALCMWFTDASVSAGGSGIAEESPADGPLRLFGSSQGGAPTGDHTAYGGSIDPSVVRVRVERSEGDPVDATIGDGYFLASWPGHAHATRFVAVGADGEVMAEIGNGDWDLQPAPDP